MAQNSLAARKNQLGRAAGIARREARANPYDSAAQEPGTELDVLDLQTAQTDRGGDFS